MVKSHIITTEGTYLGYRVVRKSHIIEGGETFYYYYIYKNEDMVKTATRAYSNKLSLFYAFSGDIEELEKNSWWDKSVMALK